MPKRWNVYQGGQHIGLMTAQDIRRALREGRLDPFDLVAVEGSQVKVELVEVDEIFHEETKPNLTATASDFTPPPPPPPEEESGISLKPMPEKESGTEFNPSQTLQIKPKRRVTDSDPLPINIVPKHKITHKSSRVESASGKSVRISAEASSSTSAFGYDEQTAVKPVFGKTESTAVKPVFSAAESTQNQAAIPIGEYTSVSRHPSRKSRPTSDKKKDKKFFLIDHKNRVLGPLSAVEVQSLFYRGILKNSVKVQKSGSDRRVPIRQFVSVYSGKRMKAIADQNGGNGLNRTPGHPSTKVLNELYQLINSKKLADHRSLRPLISLILLGIGIGISIYFIVGLKQSEPADAFRRRPGKPALIQNDLTSGARESERSVSKSETDDRQREPDRQPPVTAKETPKEPTRKPKKPEPKPPATTATRSPSPPPRNRPDPSSPVSVSRTANVKTPPRAAPEAPANPSPARQPNGPIAQAMSTAGTIVSVGPLSFALNDLERCELKCEITFRDAQGGSLSAVFFKGAYYEQLKTRQRGTVTLTGSSKLQDGKLILFIQDIR